MGTGKNALVADGCSYRLHKLRIVELTVHPDLAGSWILGRQECHRSHLLHWDYSHNSVEGSYIVLGIYLNVSRIPEHIVCLGQCPVRQVESRVQYKISLIIQAVLPAKRTLVILGIENPWVHPCVIGRRGSVKSWLYECDQSWEQRWVHIIEIRKLYILYIKRCITIQARQIGYVLIYRRRAISKKTIFFPSFFILCDFSNNLILVYTPIRKYR